MKNYSILTFILASILLPSFHLLAQIQEPVVARIPTASFEVDEYTYSFGVIDEGTKVEHVFTFENTSDEPLIISNAKGSCGCTVPQWPKEAIAPGDVASFTVIFNSKNKKGPRKQKVTITANTNPAQTFVYLKGKVLPKDMSKEIIKPEADLEVEESKDCIVVYPNPSSEFIKLKMEKDHIGKSVMISIFSEGTQLMAQRNIDTVEESIEFSVSHYPKGTYFANVQVEGEKTKSVCFVIIH